MLIKATVALWTRDHEDGSYSAEALKPPHDTPWKLHVTYTPEPPPPKAGPYGFSWKVTSPDGKELRSTELLEEPEMAMMQAEHAAGLHPEKKPSGEDEPTGQTAGLRGPQPDGAAFTPPPPPRRAHRAAASSR